MFHLRQDVEGIFHEDFKDLREFVYNRTEVRGDASKLHEARSMEQ